MWFLLALLAAQDSTLRELRRELAELQARPQAPGAATERVEPAVPRPSSGVQALASNLAPPPAPPVEMNQMKVPLRRSV